MIDHVRYGVELEGPHKGLPTVVLLSAAHHDLDLVLRLLFDRNRIANHVWMQVQDGEQWDWDRVAKFVHRGFKVTAQVRRREDLPPAELRGAVSLVWRVPDEYADVALACTHVAAFGPYGPFDGNESELSFAKFNTAAYLEDEIWQCG